MAKSSRTKLIHNCIHGPDAKVQHQTPDLTYT